MNIIDYYKKVLTSVGLEVNDEGFVGITTDGKFTPLTRTGKCMVLPTTEHLDTLYSTVDGETVVTKELFNPLVENAIKNTTPSIDVLKDAVAHVLGFGVVGAGKLMLLAGASQKSQTGSDYKVVEFLAKCSEAKKNGVRKAIDNTSVSTWMSLNTTSECIPTIFLKKGGKIGGEKYNRVATIKFSLYNELVNIGKDNIIRGVKLRKKDVVVFKLLFEELMPLNKDGILTLGSNCGTVPAFDSLMRAYLAVGKPIFKLFKSLKKLDPEIYDDFYVNIGITDKDLDEASDLYVIAKGYPDTDTKVVNAKPAATNNSGVLHNNTTAPQRRFGVPASKQAETQEPPAQHTPPPLSIGMPANVGSRANKSKQPKTIRQTDMNNNNLLAETHQQQQVPPPQPAYLPQSSLSLNQQPTSYAVNQPQYPQTFLPQQPVGYQQFPQQQYGVPSPQPMGVQPGVAPQPMPGAQQGYPPPFGQPVQQPFGQPVQQPVMPPPQQPFGQPVQQPFGQPAQQPFGQPAQQPDGQPAQQQTTFGSNVKW